MVKSFTILGLALFFSLPVAAEPGPCKDQPCTQEFALESASAERSYGVLIAAPDTGCLRVRYRVESVEHGFLGHTPPLAPGESAVVRMGNGFAEGVHALTIAPEGCQKSPALARRVLLHKHSPDHAWRAERERSTG